MNADYNSVMSNQCPHCAAKLPWVVDAFCPTCGNRLDEKPVEADPVEKLTASPSDRIGISTWFIVLVVGLGALANALHVFDRRDATEAMMNFGIGIALLLAFVFWPRGKDDMKNGK